MTEIANHIEHLRIASKLAVHLLKNPTGTESARALLLDYEKQIGTLIHLLCDELERIRDSLDPDLLMEIELLTWCATHVLEDVFYFLRPENREGGSDPPPGRPVFNPN